MPYAQVPDQITVREWFARRDAWVERLTPSGLVALADALSAWDLERWDLNDRGVTIGAGPEDWPGYAAIPEVGPFPHPPPMTRRGRPEIPESARWEVWERDNFTCRGCGARRYLHVDHVVPLSRGGANTTSNMQTLCRDCNLAKGARA